MARHGTNPVHWVGVLFLLVAFLCLLIVSISAPVVNDIAILKVTLTNSTNFRHSSVTFGSFGYCILDVPPVQTDQDWCSKKVIGYKPANIISDIDSTSFNTAAGNTINNLTGAMVLHPVSCVLAFLAFLSALGAGCIGAILASAMAALAWLLTLIIMAIDFSIFGAVKNHVNKDGSGSHAVYSAGMWLVLAAMILLFFAMFMVLFTCVSQRRSRRNPKSYGDSHVTTTTTRRRRKRFGIF